MSILRKIVLKTLKITAFDLKIKHHFTNRKFLLNSYNHKGYWYFGAKREKNTIKQFQSWIKPNYYVLEIGGHIGYFTTFYANLVGLNGKVDVFEPSEKNLKYLKANINLLDQNLQKIVSVVKKGAANINGNLKFYIDPITGQNNSFVENFEGFYSNREASAESNAALIEEVVTVIKLDTYFENANQFPDFVKIDVEGFEWDVVQGFEQVIKKHKPKLMIEIQADADKIIAFFIENNYNIFNDKMQEIHNLQDYKTFHSANIFFKIRE